MKEREKERKRPSLAKSFLIILTMHQIFIYTNTAHKVFRLGSTATLS